MEAAVDGAQLHVRATDGRVVEHSAVNHAGEIDLAIGRIDGKRARILAGGQYLDDGLGVGHVLANDRQTSGVAPVRGKDQPAIGVVPDSIGADADGKRRHGLAGVSVQGNHAHIGAGGKEPRVSGVDGKRPRALAIRVEGKRMGKCVAGR